MHFTHGLMVLDVCVICMLVSYSHPLTSSAKRPGRCTLFGLVCRDDDYLRDALHIIARLYTCHVMRGVDPGPSPWAGLPGYRSFLDRTADIARGAQCVMELPTTPVVAGADLNPFWNMRT